MKIQMSKKLKNLFTPLDVANVTLRNRIISSPIDIHVSKEKATSGSSLIVLGEGFISKELRGRIAPKNTNPFELENVETAAKTRRKLEFWRQGGSLVSIELLHSGMYGAFKGTDYVYGVCEGIRDDNTKIVEVNEEIMAKICEEYYESAKAAKFVGFDMVTAHFAHGWLASEFLSPTWNKRTDEYGGSYENRIKFPRMILQSIRKAVGPNFPIDMRINGKDWIGKGMELEEVARFLQDMADEGLVSMANISVGADIELLGNIRMASHPNHGHMVNIELSKFIKERVSIPITVVGAIETPEQAEYIIANGYADAVWIGRAMVADPSWAKKAYEDKSEDIMPCLRCLYCFPLATRRKNFGCSVNPRFNKEAEYPQGQKAQVVKKVVVIGGGPAGMRAAITADQRGHKVTLVEKKNILGGVIRFTDYVESKKDLNRYLKYLERHVKNSKIDVKLNFEANHRSIKELNPDVVMIAIGAEAFVPLIKGIDRKNVLEALEVFPKLKEMKGNIAVIGGGTVGCEIAIDLAKEGKNVTIIEMTDTLNANANRLYKVSLDEEMKEYSEIKSMANTKCSEITEDGVIVIDEDGKTIEVIANQVVIATGYKPKKDLVKTFFGITPETYVIGDCNKVGMIKNTSEDAYMFSTNIL